MDVAQAIRILDPETTIEALAEIEYYAGFGGPTAKVQAVSDACEIAVAIMKIKLQEAKKGRLKKKDLPAVVDQPLWVVPLGEEANDCKAGWAVWDGNYIYRRSISIERKSYLFRAADYGKRWIAYHHQPTEESK